MKTLLSIAAAFAAITSASAAFANDAQTTAAKGHYEWQSRSVFGPNKSTFPTRFRVWVKDRPEVASCDCAMMHETASAADCTAMPHKGGSPSHG